MEMEVSKGKRKATMGGKRSRTSSGTKTAATVERKEVEKERRQHMKQLCAKLASLIPKENCSSTDTMTQLGSLDEAAKYIHKLKERVNELRQRRSSLQARTNLKGIGGVSTSNNTTRNGGVGSSDLEGKKGESALVVEVRQHDGSSMDVVLICNANRPVKLHEVITILEEEGAEIVNANRSIIDLKILYIIHSRAFISRIGIEVSRVSERLRALV
uniref:Uncharacterized protein n=1 Tax=Avena sativa TaxID=4498 RepID=A0ACD5TSD1_AVESA